VENGGRCKRPAEKKSRKERGLRELIVVQAGLNKRRKAEGLPVRAEIMPFKVQKKKGKKHPVWEIRFSSQGGGRGGGLFTL